MDQEDQQHKMTFSKKSAWIGLAAYIVFLIIIVVLYLK